MADPTARKAAPLLEPFRVIRVATRSRFPRLFAREGPGRDAKDAVVPRLDSERGMHASAATARGSPRSSCAAANPSWRSRARRAAVQPDDTRRGLAGTREAPRLPARPRARRPGGPSSPAGPALVRRRPGRSATRSAGRTCRDPGPAAHTGHRAARCVCGGGRTRREERGPACALGGQGGRRARGGARGSAGRGPARSSPRQLSQATADKKDLFVSGSAVK